MTEATNFSLPDLKSRFRCTHCGNLTRFDVTRASKVKEFWHADMSGEVTVEEREVLSDQVLAVSCRWCGAGDRIEIVLRPEFGGPSQESAGDGGV
jgi:RNase P subunit RPR2